MLAAFNTSVGEIKKTGIVLAALNTIVVKIKKTQKITLNEGDIVHIPAKTLHTHGSVDKKKPFSHIAINILPRKNAEYKTVWWESDFKTKATAII